MSRLVRIHVEFDAIVDLALLRRSRQSYPAITPKSDEPADWTPKHLFALIDDGEEPTTAFPVGDVASFEITEAGVVVGEA